VNDWHDTIVILSIAVMALAFLVIVVLMYR
jgi:hypothetical protein